jgi:hypothetical protein
MIDQGHHHMHTKATKGLRRASSRLTILLGACILVALSLPALEAPGSAGASPASAAVGPTALSGLLSPVTGILQDILGPKAAPDATPTPAPVPAAAPADAAPLAPTTVTASQNGPSPDLVVSWTYPSGGAPVTGTVVQLSQIDSGVPTYLEQIQCGACTTTTLRGLSFGTTYQATLYLLSAGGAGPPATSPAVTLSTSCGAGACITFDATDPIGPANHAASGLLESLTPNGKIPAEADAIGTNFFRGVPNQVSPTENDWTSFDVADAVGAQTMVELDELWAEDTDPGNVPNDVPTPWSNWSAYSSWVSSTVSTLLASGQKIDYWEIYNEPGGNDGLYTAAGWESETPDLLLEQFLVAYDAVKSVDPTAQIVGPDTEFWNDYPSEFASSNQGFDMVTFLNFAAFFGLKLAAISWHEILDNVGPTPEDNTIYPAIIENHVAEARALIAAHPDLGDPQIFITEYGIPEVQKIPGWDVAYLSALTDAGVNVAVRSCWNADCPDGDLDGLLTPNGQILPEYYDRLIYASMSGQMVDTTSSSDTVTALGSFDSEDGTLTGLIGRGVGCAQNQPLCTAGFIDGPKATATSVSVTVTVPWTSGTAHIVLRDISGAMPNFPDLLPPLPIEHGAPIVDAGPHSGTITFQIPIFADGDAYGVSITH